MEVSPPTENPTTKTAARRSSDANCIITEKNNYNEMEACPTVGSNPSKPHLPQPRKLTKTTIIIIKRRKLSSSNFLLLIDLMRKRKIG